MQLDNNAMRTIIIGDMSSNQDLPNQSDEIKRRLSQLGIKTCNKDRASVFIRSTTFLKKVKNELGEEVLEEDYLSEEEEAIFLKRLEELVSGK